MRGLASGFDTSLFIATSGDGLAAYPKGLVLGAFGEEGHTTTGTGWRVEGLAAGQYARMEWGVIRPASAFSATPQPSGAPDDTLKDGFRSEVILNGTIAAGDWLPSLPLIAVAGEGADVRVRFRVWKSVNADMSAATEVTSGAVVGSTITSLLDDVQQISAGTVNLPEVTLANEYLFVQVALETV